MYRKLTFHLLCVVILAASAAVDVPAAGKKTVGRVLNISGKTIIAGLDEVSCKVGDEVEIIRREKIVDPLTGKVRGERPVSIAQGIIVDLGLGKANIRVEPSEGKAVKVDDIVVLTGREKKIIRPEGPKAGEIQEITEDTIVTDLGAEDDISPGDVFLIQRQEPIIDPETNEITGFNSVNVGRYTVDEVSENRSVARVLEQNLVPQKTDIVYKESEYLKYLASMKSDSLKIASLEKEVNRLKKQLRAVRAKLDSLAEAHSVHLNEYEMLKHDIEAFLTQAMRGDISGSRIRIKNDEPITAGEAGDLFTAYKKALDDCLDHKLESAIREFNAIIAAYPESKLTENCRYWIAQSYFAMKAYPQAADGFLAVINDTRFNHKDDDAAIMLGITYLRMNRIEDARAQFQRFIEEYPDSEYIDKVSYWMSRLPSS